MSEESAFPVSKQSRVMQLTQTEKNDVTVNIGHRQRNKASDQS